MTSNNIKAIHSDEGHFLKSCHFSWACRRYDKPYLRAKQGKGNALRVWVQRTAQDGSRARPFDFPSPPTLKK
jgi:hypothetical protein